jgi:hypothetical protein
MAWGACGVVGWPPLGSSCASPHECSPEVCHANSTCVHRHRHDATATSPRVVEPAHTSQLVRLEHSGKHRPHQGRRDPLLGPEQRTAGDDAPPHRLSPCSPAGEPRAAELEDFSSERRVQWCFGAAVAPRGRLEGGVPGPLGLLRCHRQVRLVNVHP